MQLAIIGTGYVGLVAGACFADTGNTVWCVDLDEKKIEGLKRGVIPIYEPGLEALVKQGVEQERLKFTTSTAEAVRASEMVFMAVQTPSLPNGDVDLKYLKAAAEEVGRSLNGYKLIVNKSTVPIGSSKTVREWISGQTRESFDVVSNPEFLKEGSAIDDFLRPDRVVIGTEKEEVYSKMAELYAPFVRQGNPIVWMEPVSAEITKYAANSFLATKISFMNELSVLCEKVGGDIEEVRRGITSDARIGKHFFYAGAGYGGSCFPKDVKGLLATAKQHGVPLGIIAAAEDANGRQKDHMAQKIRSHFGGKLEGRTIGIWGLAFKPNTDDMREAPSIVIIESLLKAGARVRAFDPVAQETARQVFGDRITYCKKSYDAADGSDALVLVTEWNEFRLPDFARLKTLLKKPVIFDGRNIFSPAQLRAQGFEYIGVGRS